jgi:hypothetical protein
LATAADSQTYHRLGTQQIRRFAAGAFGIPAEVRYLSADGSRFDPYNGLACSHQMRNENGHRRNATCFDPLHEIFHLSLPHTFDSANECF